MLLFRCHHHFQLAFNHRVTPCSLNDSGGERTVASPSSDLLVIKLLHVLININIRITPHKAPRSNSFILKCFSIYLAIPPISPVRKRRNPHSTFLSHTILFSRTYIYISLSLSLFLFLTDGNGDCLSFCTSPKAAFTTLRSA